MKPILIAVFSGLIVLCYLRAQNPGGERDGNETHGSIVGDERCLCDDLESVRRAGEMPFLLTSVMSREQAHLVIHQARPQVTTDSIDVGGAKLYYEESGKGEPVILIHGGLIDHRMWDDQFGVFAKQYRVIRYDARDHGRSRCEPGTYSHHEDLNRLMEALGIRKAVLIGLSMGGFVAIDFALAYPEKVSALIPVSSGLTGYDFKEKEVVENNRQQARAIQAGDVETWVEYFQRAWTDGPRRAPSQVDSVVRRKVQLMALETARNRNRQSRLQRLSPPAIGRLAELRVPTLVIVGDLDMPGIHEIAGMIENNVAGARRVVISGAAHMVNMEKPKEFNTIVLDFLSTL